jgi:preprotein translocase subunit Sec61beta
MTLIKKMMPEKKKIDPDVLVGFGIVLLVLILVAIFFPMLIMPLLK